MIPTIAIILALALSGGVSAAAEHAVPGDILYPVKVNVNEGARSVFVLKPEGKARVEADRIERRMEEMLALIAEGVMDAQTQAAMEARIEAHAKRMETHLAKLASRADADAIRVRAELEARLKAKENFLKRAPGRSAIRINLPSAFHEVFASASSSADLANVRLGVRSSSTSTSSTASRGHKAPDVAAAVLGRMNAEERKLDEVRRFIAQAEERYGADAVARAAMHLQEADGLFSEGDAAFKEERYADAFRLLQDAHRQAQEAKLFVELQKKFDLDFSFHSGTTTVSTSRRILTDVQEKKAERKKLMNVRKSFSGE